MEYKGLELKYEAIEEPCLLVVPHGYEVHYRAEGMRVTEYFDLKCRKLCVKETYTTPV